MVKLVVVLLNPLNQEYSLPMNYFSFPILTSKTGPLDFFTNLIKFILNPTLFKKLIKNKREANASLKFYFLKPNSLTIARYLVISVLVK